MKTENSTAPNLRCDSEKSAFAYIPALDFSPEAPAQSVLLTDKVVLKGKKDVRQKSFRNRKDSFRG